MANAEEYEMYAEHCLKIARLSDNRQDRILQREMVSEWLRLAADLRITKAYTKLVDDIGACRDHGTGNSYGPPP
jgi:hypothetical protein